MKKICFVTAARSEYGLLKWLMKDVDASEEFELQLVVTGGHLSQGQGYTVDQIIEDGFKISYIVDAELDISAPVRIAESMGRMSQGFAKAFEAIQPDYLLILGDRYELLPICSTALVMRIPIVHLCGGDVTEGAIDDGVRNAVTMLADYHFVGTPNSACNIERMRGSQSNIWIVGEPGLDAFRRNKLLSREELAVDLGLDKNKRWGIMTYHAVTKESLGENLQTVQNIMEVLLLENDLQTVVTYANADFGGKQINDLLETIGEKHPQNIRIIPSLGQRRYLSYMKQVDFMIGNSSSGIVEAPFLNVPVINIGDRQKGRYLCGNVIQCSSETEMIRKCLKKVPEYKSKLHNDLFYWGDGYTSEKIINIMKEMF